MQLLIDAGVIAGMAFVIVLVGWHFRQEAAQVEERTEEEAAPVQEDAPLLPPLEPLKTSAEFAEVADKTQWLHTMAEALTVPDDLTGGALNLERPAGDILCDRPLLPPRDSELWLSIRLAAMRGRPVSWRRLDKAISPEWAEMITVRAKAMEQTQEITPEMRAKVLGGAS
jgi:hypothetical protein